MIALGQIIFCPSLVMIALGQIIFCPSVLPDHNPSQKNNLFYSNCVQKEKKRESKKAYIICFFECVYVCIVPPPPSIPPQYTLNPSPIPKI